MIHIKANNNGVAEVVFTGSTVDRAIDMALYPAIQHLVGRMDRRLRSLNRAVLREIQIGDRKASPALHANGAGCR